MRKEREILRLGFMKSMSMRTIAKLTDTKSHNTVSMLLKAADAANLTWEEVVALDDTELEVKLAYKQKSARRNQNIPMPDYAALVTEKQKNKNMTMSLQWEEYRFKEPNGYQYSQFCEHYRTYIKTLNLSMRQCHIAGEKMFVDFSGKRPEITNRKTGVKTPMELFVAVLGASTYTYCEAVPSQSIPDWIAANIRALHFFGGVPKIIVPDNLKSAVTKPDRYEPEIQMQYQQFAEHYSTVIMPARVRHPRDKPKVEGAVLHIYRWIILRLRHQTFFSLIDLNNEIQRLLTLLNAKPFKKLPGCRRSRYEELDRPALGFLPSTDYEFAKIKLMQVGNDYHVNHDNHYYSVPHTLVGKQIETRVTAKVIEILYKGKRIASHILSDVIGGKTTLDEHMPSKHFHYLEWTPINVAQWAVRIGPSAIEYIQYQLHQRGKPIQGLQSCVGLIHLQKKFPNDRIEKACRRAIAIGSINLTSVKSILQTGTDSLPLPISPPHDDLSIAHENVRGPEYFL